MELKDKSLFRSQCYIDGAWCDAESGATIDVAQSPLLISTSIKSNLIMILDDSGSMSFIASRRSSLPGLNRRSALHAPGRGWIGI